jgi:hypothetical protein
MKKSKASNVQLRKAARKEFRELAQSVGDEVSFMWALECRDRVRTEQDAGKARDRKHSD